MTTETTQIEESVTHEEIDPNVVEVELELDEEDLKSIQTILKQVERETAEIAGITYFDEAEQDHANVVEVHRNQVDEEIQEQIDGIVYIPTFQESLTILHKELNKHYPFSRANVEKILRGSVNSGIILVADL